MELYTDTGLMLAYKILPKDNNRLYIPYINIPELYCNKFPNSVYVTYRYNINKL